MVPFNHTESWYTLNCLVIRKQKLNVYRIGYKYSKINQNFFRNEKEHWYKKNRLVILLISSQIWFGTFWSWSVFTDYQPLFRPLMTTSEANAEVETQLVIMEAKLSVQHSLNCYLSFCVSYLSIHYFISYKR